MPTPQVTMEKSPRRPQGRGLSSGRNITLTILSSVSFTFVVYFIIGLSLAILPIYVHLTLGYSSTIAGLVISAQYIATLLSRTDAGRKADRVGAKTTVLAGLLTCAVTGVLLIAAGSVHIYGLDLVFLLIGRLVLGVAESWVATGATLWGMGRVGYHNTTRVISWNGVATYSALASGAPIGVVLERIGGIPLVGAVVIAVSLIAYVLARPIRPSRVARGEQTPFSRVFWRVLPHGVGLALGGIGFGVIGTFITLFYASRQWPNAALSLTVFGLAFVAIRLLFARMIDRFGGFRAAMVSFAVEGAGLLLLTLATSPVMALMGCGLAGCGFSLIFPALGIEAVSRVSSANRGAALGVYSIFVDVSIGLTGPLAGLVIGKFGYPAIFLIAAFAAGGACILAAVMRVRTVRDRRGQADRGS